MRKASLSGEVVVEALEASFQEVRISERKRGIRELFLAFRPWSFPMTAVSVTVGSMMGLLLQGVFYPGLAFLVLVGMVAIHGATNILNDYFDTLYGADRPGAPTTLYRTHPILGKVFSPKEIIIFSLILYSIAALICIYLAGLRGWPIIAMTIAGCFASVFYTAGPVKYKYRGLGEISVFLMWGPLMTVGSYYVQTGVWEGAAVVLCISLPLGIWVALVLLANNLKDMHYDSEMKIMTVTIWLGRVRAIKLFAWLVYGVYMLIGFGIILGYLSWWVLAVFLSLPSTLQLMSDFKNQPEIPVDADPKTARLSTMFGVLFILSLITEHFFPLS
ncbi:MAG: prenyltransferase [Bacillota bacterium]|nr:prenyltransferase [Bacillota bacterium]